MDTRTRISVQFSYTVNVGNYESVKISYGLSRDLLDGETMDEAYDEEYTYLQELTMDKVSELKPKKGRRNR